MAGVYRMYRGWKNGAKRWVTSPTPKRDLPRERRPPSYDARHECERGVDSPGARRLIWRQFSRKLPRGVALKAGERKKEKLVATRKRDTARGKESLRTFKETGICGFKLGSSACFTRSPHERGGIKACAPV